MGKDTLYVAKRELYWGGCWMARAEEELDMSGHENGLAGNHIAEAMDCLQTAKACVFSGELADADREGLETQIHDLERRISKANSKFRK